ncbi:hypothetical protein CBR_g54082 [Chara braunii]|uniref:Uncharacterized protein n=1 Tax=Chara braunii TaxID=69332 RepID=A0A388MBP8_CHABU|nr:hypothetical protein CBR_g54082 [Chara braunii]|eukprot:GBG91987.1 hypothetical protein CBR_g54082 [Chara braunii]
MGVLLFETTPGHPMVWRRRAAGPSDGLASSTRRTLQWSGVVEAPDPPTVWVQLLLMLLLVQLLMMMMLKPHGYVVVGAAAAAAAVRYHYGFAGAAAGAAAAAAAVRYRYGFDAVLNRARPSDGLASLRRRTLRWSGIVEAPDPPMVWRCRGAGPSDGLPSSRRRTLQWSGASTTPDHNGAAAAAAVRCRCIAGGGAAAVQYPYGVAAVRNRAGPSDGLASSRRRTPRWSGVVEVPDPPTVWVQLLLMLLLVRLLLMLMLKPHGYVVAGAAVAAAAVRYHYGFAGAAAAAAAVRYRYGFAAVLNRATPSDGLASSRRQTLRWSGVVEAPDPPMVWRRRGAGPSDGLASSRRRTLQWFGASTTPDHSGCAVDVVGGPTAADAAAVPYRYAVAGAATAAAVRCRYIAGGAAAAVRYRYGVAAVRNRAGSSNGMASSRRRTLLWSGASTTLDRVSTSKVVERAVTFQEKYWAIDWHLGMKVPCCGPCIFLRDESGSYYPCGGIKTYSFDKNMPDEEYMRFHLTTCFDSDGHEVPDNYKLVSLQVDKFQGYGIRAASMPPFDKSKKKDASQMVMLRPFEFLKRINCYKVSGHIVAIDNKLQLSTPFVSFDCDLGDFADMVRRHKLQAMCQAVCELPVCATRAPSHANYAARVSLTPAGGAADHEDDDESTEEDSRFRHWDGGRWADGNDAKDAEGDDDEQQFSDGAHDEEGSLEDDLAEGDGSEGQEDGGHEASKPGELTNDTIDTTKCFFLEYDEDGNAIDRPTQVFVDLVKILPNPSEGVQYNHRSLNEMLVTSIRDAMEHPKKQEWERNTWILAPVVEVEKDGQKRWERVKPEDWDDDKVASYHWYTVAGQHTAEAAKRLVAAKSSAAHKWGVHSWKARVVYFDDDHLEGYAYISTFDNTRETRAIPSSFRMVVTAIRGMWQSMKEPKGDWHQAKTVEERTAQRDQYQEFIRKAIRMTPDTSLWNQSLAKRFVRNWSNLLRRYMCLAASGRVMWNLVEKFFDKWEKGELPGQDGVRPVFGDFTSREKEMTLEKILAGHVVVTSGRAFVKKLMNMQDMYVEVRRERYMVRMFNYVLFKIEQRSEGEWNDKFFIGYDTIMRRFAPRGLTTEKWEETKSKIVAEKTIDVPKRLGGVDEAKLGKGNVGGYKVMTAIYMECPYFLKLFVHEILGAIEQLRDELRRIISNAQHIMWDKRKDHTTWDGVIILPGRWRRYSEAASSCAQVGNLPLRGRDSMTIVLHDTDNDLKKVTVAKPRGNTLFDTHYVEELFVRCTKEAISVRGDNKPVYGIWEREPAKMKDLCTWFSKEGEGVLILGNVQAGTTWDLLRSGRHVVACDGSSNLMEYSTLFIDRHVHNPDKKCHFEPPKPQHRADRDMFLKLGKKRDSLWSYLFCNAPATPTDADYLHRKVIAIQHLQGYHNAKRGAIEIFLGQCEHLWFERKRDKIDAKVYCEVMDVGEQFDIMDNEEETKDEEIDLPLPDAHQNAVRDETPPLSAMGGEQAMKEDVGGTIASTKPDNVMHGTMPKTGGAMEGSTSKCGMKKATPGFVSLVRRVCNDIEGAADDETQNVARADKESVDDQDGMDIADDTLFHIPDDVPKQLAPGDNISYDMKEMKGGPHFLETKYKESYEHDWGHHIIWHPGLFEPCVIDGRWHMAIRMGGKWMFRERVLRSRFYEIAKDNLSTRVKQANREAPDHKISNKVNSLFEFLRENHLLEYCAAFYDKKSSPSYGAVIWSVDYRATDCTYDSDILVGCSQGLEEHTGARKKIDSAATGVGGESVADKEGHLRMQNAMGDEFSERPSSTPQPTLRPSEGISAVGAISETTPTAGGEVVGDDGKDEKIEEDQRQKALDEEGPKFQAHEVVKAVSGHVDSHSKQSQGTHDTTVISAQAQGTDEDTREQSAHKKDGGEGPVLMECTGPGTQIVSESTMGERRADVEGVSGAEHEKVPSTTNREREEENENEEEANKRRTALTAASYGMHVTTTYDIIVAAEVSSASTSQQPITPTWQQPLGSSITSTWQHDVKSTWQQQPLGSSSSHPRRSSIYIHFAAARRGSESYIHVAAEATSTWQHSYIHVAAASHIHVAAACHIHVAAACHIHVAAAVYIHLAAGFTSTRQRRYIHVAAAPHMQQRITSSWQQRVPRGSRALHPRIHVAAHVTKNVTAPL